MSFPNSSSAGLDGIAPPSFEKYDSQVERANWTRRKRTFRTAAVLLWCETNCAKKARWRTSSYRCRKYFPPVVRKMCPISCLRNTSRKIRKSTSSCRHQKGTELKRFQFEKPTSHATKKLKYTLKFKNTHTRRTGCQVFFTVIQ